MFRPLTRGEIKVRTIKTVQIQGCLNIGQFWQTIVESHKGVVVVVSALGLRYDCWGFDTLPCHCIVSLEKKHHSSVFFKFLSSRSFVKSRQLWAHLLDIII